MMEEKMGIKLRDVIEAETSLSRLFGCHPKKAKDTYRVARMQREIVPILKDYEDARQQLLEQYAVKSKTEPNRWQFIKVDEDGEPILEYDEGDTEKKNGKTMLDLEALDTFTSDLNELLDGESVEVTCFITLAQIERLGLDPVLTPGEMATLWWLIREFQENTDVGDD
jgi:hypothetical protein